MRPMKGAVPFAKWLLRFSLIVFLFTNFFDIIKEFNFTDPDYLIAFGFIFASALLIVGGFFPRSTLTVISGILIFALCLFVVIWNYIATKTIEPELIAYLMPAAIGFYFFARGNRG